MRTEPRGALTGRLSGRAGHEDEDAAEDEGDPHGGGQGQRFMEKEDPEAGCGEGLREAEGRGGGGGRHLEPGEGEGKGDGRGHDPEMQGHERAHGRRQPRRRVDPEDGQHTQPAQEAQDHHDGSGRGVLGQRLAEHEIAGVGEPREQGEGHAREAGPAHGVGVEQDQPDQGEPGGGIPCLGGLFAQEDQPEQGHDDGREANGDHGAHGDPGFEHAPEKEELEAEQGEGGRHDAAHGPAPEPGELPPERAPEEQGQAADEHTQRADDVGRRPFRGQGLDGPRGAETQGSQKDQKGASGKGCAHGCFSCGGPASPARRPLCNTSCPKGGPRRSKAANKDSINAKVLGERGVGFGEGRGNLSPDKV